METQGDPKIFLLLLAIFLVVGIYLFFYSKKKNAMISNFSRRRGLSYKESDKGNIERELNDKFQFLIREKGLVRSFSKVRNIATDGEVTLFSCIELLDLNPYRRRQLSHNYRNVVIFNIPDSDYFIYTVSPQGSYKVRYPRDKNIEEEECFKIIQPLVESKKPRYPLTISFNKGGALIYLEPFVVGGEKEEDLEYIFDLGIKIREKLNKI
jgi:hypothetical protein